MTVPPVAQSAGTPVVYDFRQPMTLPRDHARVLEVALTTFARQWANQLLARLRVPVQVSLDHLSMSTYDEFVSRLPAPTTLIQFTAGPNRRPAIIQIPLEVTLSWVDQMLGGPGTPGAVPVRELTEIEQNLVSDVMSRVVADLNYAFAGILKVDPELRRIQHSPQLVQAVAATTTVISGTFHITHGDQYAVAAFMAPAEGLLSALRERQSADHRTTAELAAETEQRQSLDRAVQEVPVEVAVRLGPVALHPREVVGLAVGDLLALRHPRSQPMDVVVGDRVLAQAVAGTSGSRLAGLVVNVKENS
ncbi:flagellar motor switch protein FliM [Georgenia sp. 311]|uniref:Flagellar motor switch protein FliM n=1 Tax=Georgenia wutianyii TaxID=2585135 RepID=A0ABX5VK42_9MICO|nr:MULTISPECIES: flagellar motor switch protein FliM [Georgenia]QDB78178.1 flagellar motor switch protein FliM [Georgenia wutianyii]TNC21246.1 flagellar motor switch protein FliM [Georgenia sp. 311]